MKSRKLWILIGLTVVMTVLNAIGTVTSSDLTNFLTWSYGLYAAGNVGTKIVTKG